MPDWTHIRSILADSGVTLGAGDAAVPVGGGDISAAWRLESAGGPVFLKTGPRTAADMFAAEAEGLAELEAADAVRVPRPLAYGATDNSAFLALEWLRFSSPAPYTQELLGERLAALHRHTADRFGWHRDNTIGRTPQRNPWHVDWIEFFRNERLRFQLDLAKKNGFSGRLATRGDALSACLPELFADYQPVPSLLHGDLWGGNWASVDGQPVIYDPAVYYGDRESDLAMTRLFGGFSRDFYAAYEHSWPLAPGSDRRIRLYQLYHVLNHLNLFGRGYLERAEMLLEELLTGA